MKLYWRVSRFPELEHLTPAERRSLLRRVGVWRLYVSTALAGIAFGTLVGIVVVAVLPSWARQSPWPFAAVMLLVAVVAFQLAIRALRRVMRKTLRGLAERQRLPVCLGCGYALAGVEADACPECGAPIPGPSAAPPATAPASTRTPA